MSAVVAPPAPSGTRRFLATDNANRARTPSRDSIVTQYRTRFAGTM